MFHTICGMEIAETERDLCFLKYIWSRKSNISY